MIVRSLPALSGFLVVVSCAASRPPPRGDSGSLFDSGSTFDTASSYDTFSPPNDTQTLDTGRDVRVANDVRSDVRPDTRVDSGTLVIPADPGSADVRFDINSTRSVHPISPWIYGANQVALSATHGATATRLGGNRWSAYNWETNASNAGSDYMFQNDTFLGGGTEPGGAIREPVAAAHAAGLAALITIPIAGYVAADTTGPTDSHGADRATRFFESRPLKGAAYAATPDVADRIVYQDELVDWVRRTLIPSGTVFFSLDNEPDLWSGTHPEMHPDDVTYAELVRRNTEYASAIKTVIPTAIVFGPVSYGWYGYRTLQDAPDAMGRDFLTFWLDSMSAAERTAGHRLVDVLDLHWYAEATGGSGVRITGDDVTSAVSSARVQAPRSLWDPTYEETSWITSCCGLGPIRLIPRIRESIDTHYPGTKISFSEYNFGAGGDISGAVAEADALGIFGRENVFSAMWWQLGSARQYVDAAFDMFRSFDGAGSKFGDTAIEAQSNHVDVASIYASVDAMSADRMVLVAINRATTTRRAGVAITHSRQLTHARAYQLTSAHANPVSISSVSVTARNAFAFDMPARSVTTIELSP